MTCIKFRDTPTDTITDILVNDGKIYVSSWDGFVYVYDFYTQILLYKIKNFSPILKMLWKNNLVCGDTEGFLNFENSNTKSFDKINFNFRGISTIETYKDAFLLCGFQKRVCIFDRSGQCTFFNVENKVYNSILSDNDLILNFGFKIGFYDLRTLKIYKEVVNKKIIRSLYKNADKLYIGDIEGKLKILNIFTNDEIIVNAHCEILNNTKKCYPVNSIIYNNYLYTGGSDGIVSRWKEEDKLKSKMFFKNSRGVLKITSYNDKLIIGCGYNYERGRANTDENFIFML